MTFLNCIACQQQLNQPVTLSCGYTVCLKCLPSETAFQRSTFVCPVKECKTESHLFGPNLYMDSIVQELIVKDLIHKERNEALYTEIASSMQCPIGHHLLEGPITNHCGHSFCRLCLLQYKITNDACNKCQKRLPSYQFIQKQSPNEVLENILEAFAQFKPTTQANEIIHQQKELANIDVSFSDLQHTTYNNIPIFLSDFTVLPSQKLRIPICTEVGKKIFQTSLLSCREYQFLCFAILGRDKANMKGHFGSIVKVTSVEQRNHDLIIDVRAMDRFQVSHVNKEAEDMIIADIEMKFEAADDVMHVLSNTKHWSDRSVPSPPSSPMNIDSTVTCVPSPMSTLQEEPSSPPFTYYNPDSAAVKLSTRVHTFISDLAHSTPSTSFCSAIEGLLGPVWLNSVQGIHGPLPAAENPVAMCWWAAVVLPVGNADRYQLLETLPLVDRLNIILSWINDLQSQWGTVRQTAINSAAKVGGQLK